MYFTNLLWQVIETKKSKTSLLVMLIVMLIVIVIVIVIVAMETK